MINIINTINTPHFNFKGKRNQCRNKSFHTPVCDSFCKSTERKDTQISMSTKYKQQNPQFNKDNTINTLEQRAKKMPMIMDSIMLGVVGYLKGNIDRTNYAQIHIDRAVPFYTRIELGEDTEGYKENYKNEISLVKAISEVCDSYTRNKTDADTFDSVIEASTETYVNTDIKNQKRFVI